MLIKNNIVDESSQNGTHDAELRMTRMKEHVSRTRNHAIAMYHHIKMRKMQCFVADGKD